MISHLDIVTETCLLGFMGVAGEMREPQKQIAQFLWVGPGLSGLESVCLQSFVDVGYEVHLYAYGPLADRKSVV